MNIKYTRKVFGEYFDLGSVLKLRCGMLKCHLLSAGEPAQFVQQAGKIRNQSW